MNLAAKPQIHFILLRFHFHLFEQLISNLQFSHEMSAKLMFFIVINGDHQSSKNSGLKLLLFTIIKIS